jgi:hypothetical protein
MNDRADAAGATGVVAKMLYTSKYNAGTNFILFAVAVKLKALIQ